MVRLEGYDEPQAGPALGRPAAARRARAGARQPAPRAAARRAARRARPQAPRGDAGRAQGHPAAGRDHVHLRDPRPGGGAHDERPDRGVQPRPDRAGRRARPSSTSSPRRGSWPGFVGTSNLLTGEAARPIVGTPGTFTVRPEKIRLAAPATTPADDEVQPRTARSGRSCTSARIRATSWRSTRAPSSSSRSRTCARPRPRRSPQQGRPCGSSGNGSTACPSRTARQHRGGGTDRMKQREDPGAWRGVVAAVRRSLGGAAPAPASAPAREPRTGERRRASRPRAPRPASARARAR